MPTALDTVKATLKVDALSTDDLDHVYLTWMASATGHLEQACEELGVALPNEGPGFYRRLRDRVAPVLQKQMRPNVSKPTITRTR